MFDRIKTDGSQKEQWESVALAVWARLLVEKEISIGGTLSTATSTTSSTNNAGRFHNTNFFYF